MPVTERLEDDSPVLAIGPRSAAGSIIWDLLADRLARNRSGSGVRSDLFEPRTHFSGSRDDGVAEEVLRSKLRQVDRRLQREDDSTVGEDTDGPLVLDDDHAADVLPGHVGLDLLHACVAFRGHTIRLDELFDDDRPETRSTRPRGALRRESRPAPTFTWHSSPLGGMGPRQSSRRRPPDTPPL